MQHVTLDLIAPLATIASYIDGIRNGWAYLVNGDRQQFALQVKEGPLPLYAVGFEWDDCGYAAIYRVQKPCAGPADHLYSCARHDDCREVLRFPPGTVLRDPRRLASLPLHAVGCGAALVLQGSDGVVCRDWFNPPQDVWFVVGHPSQAEADELGRRVGCLDPAVALRGARHPDPCPSCPPAGCAGDLPCAGVA